MAIGTVLCLSLDIFVFKFIQIYRFWQLCQNIGKIVVQKVLVPNVQNKIINQKSFIPNRPVSRRINGFVSWLSGLCSSEPLVYHPFGVRITKGAIVL